MNFTVAEYDLMRFILLALHEVPAHRNQIHNRIRTLELELQVERNYRGTN